MCLNGVVTMEEALAFVIGPGGTRFGQKLKKGKWLRNY